MRHRIQRHGFTLEHLAFAKLLYLRTAKGFAPPVWMDTYIVAYTYVYVHRYNKLTVYGK
jgi:hypothetical protein